MSTDILLNNMVSKSDINIVGYIDIQFNNSELIFYNKPFKTKSCDYTVYFY